MSTQTYRHGTMAFVVLLATVTTVGVARADEPGWCPKPGTRVSYHDTGGVGTYVSLGSNPNDSMICMHAYERNVEGHPLGRPHPVFVNIRRLDNKIYTTDSFQRMRDAIGAVLSGRSTKASYEYTLGYPGRSYVGSGVETWQRTGETSVDIQGRTVNVIMISEEVIGTANNVANFRWDMLYDPSRHVFVKGSGTGFIPAATRALSPDYVVTSISDP